MFEGRCLFGGRFLHKLERPSAFFVCYLQSVAFSLLAGLGVKVGCEPSAKLSGPGNGIGRCDFSRTARCDRLILTLRLFPEKPYIGCRPANTKKS